MGANRTDVTDPVSDEPLPATMRFVLVIGAAIFIGWCLMYALLRSRW